VPYEKTMAIVIWRMEVIYVHRVMVCTKGAEWQSIARSNHITPQYGFCSHNKILSITLGPRLSNMRNLTFNAHRGYFPLPNMSTHGQHHKTETSLSKARRRISSGFRTFVHHFKKHVGVGIICSVAYFDPYATH